MSFKAAPDCDREHEVPHNWLYRMAHCSAPEGRCWPAGRAPQTLLSHGAGQQVDPAAAGQAGAASAPPCRPVAQALQRNSCDLLCDVGADSGTGPASQYAGREFPGLQAGTAAGGHSGWQLFHPPAGMICQSVKLPPAHWVPAVQCCIPPGCMLGTAGRMGGMPGMPGRGWTPPGPCARWALSIALFAIWIHCC